MSVVIFIGKFHREDRLQRVLKVSTHASMFCGHAHIISAEIETFLLRNHRSSWHNYRIMHHGSYITVPKLASVLRKLLEVIINLNLSSRCDLW